MGRPRCHARSRGIGPGRTRRRRRSCRWPRPRARRGTRRPPTRWPGRTRRCGCFAMPWSSHRWRHRDCRADSGRSSTGGCSTWRSPRSHDCPDVAHRRRGTPRYPPCCRTRSRPVARTAPASGRSHRSGRARAGTRRRARASRRPSARCPQGPRRAGRVPTAVRRGRTVARRCWQGRLTGLGRSEGPSAAIRRAFATGSRRPARGRWWRGRRSACRFAAGNPEAGTAVPAPGHHRR